MQPNSTSKMLNKMKSNLKSTKEDAQKAPDELNSVTENRIKSLDESELVMKNLMEMCLSPKGKPKLNPSS